MATRTKAPRLLDVSRLAGLAPATVSRFLNGQIELPESTRIRIHRAIAELGYRPNPYARSLSTGESGIIGLALPDIANPFFGRLAGAIEAAALRHGKGLMISSTRNCLDGEREALGQLASGLFDGLIFATNRASRGGLDAELNGLDRRVVIVDEDVPDAKRAKVLPDNAAGGRLAGRHLTEAGHRRIAMICGPEGVPSTDERGAGLRASLDAVEGARLEVVLCGDYAMEHGRAAMARILRDHTDVTAVFCAADVLLIGALGVIHQNGLEVGADISLIAFDDAAPLEFLNPPITAIRAPIAGIADAAVEALLAEDDPVGEITRCAVSLVERASVGPPRTTSNDQERDIHA